MLDDIFFTWFVCATLHRGCHCPFSFSFQVQIVKNVLSGVSISEVVLPSRMSCVVALLSINDTPGIVHPVCLVVLRALSHPFILVVLLRVLSHPVCPFRFKILR
jgi:hypothetical protein